MSPQNTGNDWVPPQASSSNAFSVRRIQLLRALLFCVFAVLVVRLFYLQVMQHDHYVKAAHSDQFREYDVMPDRGVISAQLGDKTVPIVINQKLYNIVADPTIVKDKSATAQKLASALGLSADDVLAGLKTENTRYVVLKKKAPVQVSDKVVALKLPGIAAQEHSYRAYPQGSILAQVLGFVNDDGNGVYGLEQHQNSMLKGTVGRLKAVTDVNGVPLPASDENLSIKPVAGKDVTLTINLGMQAQLETMVKNTQEKFRSKSVSAVIMETKTGAIKAMANYPTFDPAAYQKVDDASLFQNKAATLAIEPGSITKLLSLAAAVDSGAIRSDVSFYDPGKWVIDDATILDVEEQKAVGQQTLATTLELSLNTGAVWALMQMGGGKITADARARLYDYYTQHYHLGKATGVEQGYEATGYVPEPKDTGSGINLTYANMAFGQAYTATALQMVAAFNAIINGGVYYQPSLIAGYAKTDGTQQAIAPQVVSDQVVSAKTSSDFVHLLNEVTKMRVRKGVTTVNFGSNYIVGTKSGTAQVANANGTYSEDVHNGTYMGFVGGDEPQYTVVVYNIEPHIPAGKFAGAYSAQPLFAEIIHMLINNYGVMPKT